MCTLREDLGTVITSLVISLGMRNIPGKSCRENQNTHFNFKIFFPEYLAACAILLENMIESDRPQMTT